MVKVAVFDSEANGLLDEATQVWCLVFIDISDGRRFSYGPEDVASGLEQLGTYDVVVGHNIIQYDLPLFRKLKGWNFHGKVVDTLWMSRIQRPDRLAPPTVKGAGPHSIEAWGARLGRHKVVHEDWTQFSEAMLHRCEEDTEINWLVYQELLREGKGEGWNVPLRTIMRLLNYLQLQEEHGWLVDKDHIDRCIHQLDRWIHRISDATRSHLPYIVVPEEQRNKASEREELGEYKYVKKPFLKSGKPAEISIRHYPDNPGIVAGPFSRVSFRRVDLDSNDETKTFLLEAGWQPVEWNYDKKTGERRSPKLSKDDPFDGVQGSLGRLIAKRVKCRHRKSNLEGFVSAIRPDGRISPKHTGFAATGRLKHSVIVNVPSVDSGAFYGRQMRACFIASPGKVIVGSDSKGNQLRQLAARMGDAEFTRVVLFGSKENGDDLHSYNQRLSGVATRTLAKNFFYGFIFGAQDKKIGKVIGKDAAAGKVLREGYLEKLPKLAELIKRLEDEWELTATRVWNPKFNKFEYRDGYITGVDGRPILVDTKHKILNYALQSDEAIQMALAYVLVHDEMARRGYVLGADWSMLIWYHDEYQAECLPSIANELGEIMCWAIEESGKLLGIECPHGGDYKVGNSWADTH